ncbi:PKD domain-containing protein, partial [Flavobacteriaceae bacterium XHP0103]|uniref:PKD domain-containing protein n=1 Tax=Marixanthotalea marina TaxID=2844359 RepID=UPI002989A982
MKTTTSNLLFNTGTKMKSYLFGFVFLFMGLLQAQADCTIPNNMTGAQLVAFINNNNCDGTIIIPAGVQIQLYTDITIPNSIDRLIIEDGGQIMWYADVDLTLAPNSAIVIENTTELDTSHGGAGALSSSGQCNNNRNIFIGGIRYSACEGKGQVCIIFSQVIAAGGTIQIDPDFGVLDGTDNEVCFSPTQIDIELNGFVEGNPTFVWTVVSKPDAGATVTFDPNNTIQNPMVTVSEPGAYTFNVAVTLALSDDCLDQMVTVDSDIEIEFREGLGVIPMAVTPGGGGTCNLDVDFSAGITNGSSNLSYEWDFGDESGTSTDASPSYTYASSGTYNVSLTVTDNDPNAIAPCNTITVNKEVVITDEAPEISAPSPLNIEGCDTSVITAGNARYPYSTSESADIKDTYTNVADYTASDDGTIASITYIDAITNASCPLTVTRTFTITDGCGNTATAVQQIIITAPAVEVSGPEAVDTAACFYADDAALQLAYTNWLAGFTTDEAGCGSSGAFTTTPVAANTLSICSDVDISLTYTADDGC